MRRASWGLASSAVASIASCLAAAALAQVPTEYVDLYHFLDEKMTGFDRTLEARWDGRRPPVNFGGELLTANGNRGRALLTTRALAGLRLELDRLRALGLDSVTIAIPFPLLDPAFLEWSGDPADFRSFVAFFSTVVAETHARGMKLVVENGAMFPGIYSAGSGLDAASYYPMLSASQYIAGRTAQVVTIAGEIHPDLLNVGSEPDTEHRLTGQAFLGLPGSFAGMVRGFVTQVAAAGVTDVPIVAGSGSWMHDASAYVDALCDIPGLWGIDLHLYPVNYDFLDRTLDLADLARAHGKHVVLLETWLQKERDSELAQIDPAFDPTLYARDAFSFWAPLDQRFLAIVVKLAYVAQMEFVSPFWTRYFFAYLDYDQVSNASPPLTVEQIVFLATAAHAQALVDGRFTETARSYSRLIGEPRLRNRIGRR